MSVINTVMNVATNAYSAKEFGTKGLVGGAGVGLATSLLTEKATENMKDEHGNNTLTGSIVSGAISGAALSSFSTAQELYAFSNPKSLAAVSSINTTTTANAITNTISTLTSKEGIDRVKNYRKQMIDSGMSKFTSSVGAVGNVVSREMLATENFLTDFVRMGMVNNGSPNIEKMIGELESKFEENLGGKPLDGKKGFFNELKATGKTFADKIWENTKESVNIGNGKANTPWFSDKPVDIPNGDKTPTKILGTETSKERMIKYIDHYKDDIEPIFNALKAGESEGYVPKSNINNIDDYKNYINRMDAGGLATYKELKHHYRKDAPIGEKVSAFGTEIMNGSPLWARQLEKDLDNGASIVNNIKTKSGEKITNLSDEALIKTRKELADKGDEIAKLTKGVKGGNKVARVAGLVCDAVALGGAIGGIMGLAGHIASTPVRVVGNAVSDLTTAKDVSSSYNRSV